MNSLVNAYRSKYPDDPRSDDELTLLFGDNDTGNLERYADFALDYRGLKALRRLSQPTIGQEVTRGFERGAASLSQSARGAGALAADLVGAEGLRDDLARSYLEREQELMTDTSPGVARVEDIGSVEDAVRFVLGRGGELIPQVGESLLTAGAGAIAGSAAAPGPGTAAGGITGFLGRQAAKKIIKAGIEKFVTAGLVRAEAKDLVEQQLSKLARREVIDTLLPDTEKVLRSGMKAEAGKYGGLATTLANFYGIGSGTIYGDLANREGVANEDARTAALVGGLGSAVANAPLPVTVVAKILGAGSNVPRGILMRMLRDASQEIPLGAIGEAADEFVQIAAERYADPAKRGLPFDDADYSRLLNAGVVGSMAGGLAAPVSAIRTRPLPPEVEQHVADVPENERQYLRQVKWRYQNNQLRPEDEIFMGKMNTSQRLYMTAADAEAPPAPEPEPVVEPPKAETPKVDALAQSLADLNETINSLKEQLAGQQTPPAATTTALPEEVMSVAPEPQPVSAVAASPVTASVPGPEPVVAPPAPVPEVAVTPAVTPLPATMDTARAVVRMTPEEFRNQGQSFNKINFEIGRNATPEEAAELRAFRDNAIGRVTEARNRVKASKSQADMQAAMDLSAMVQFYNEAIAEYDKAHPTPVAQVPVQPTTTEEVTPTNERQKEEGRQLLTQPEAVTAPPQPTPLPPLDATTFADVDNRAVAVRSARGKKIVNPAEEAWNAQRTETMPQWKDMKDDAKDNFINQTPGLADKVRTSRPWTEDAVFRPDPKDRTKFSKGNATNPLLSESSPGPDAPKSETFRVSAILDNATGVVHLVSTWVAKKVPTVTRITEGKGKGESLANLMDAKLENGDPRYEVIFSVRTQEPRQYFHRPYPNRQEFETFAQQLEARQTKVQSAAAAVEAQVQQGAAFRPETETSAEPTVETQAEEEATPEQEAAYVDTVELPDTTDDLGLTPAEVAILVNDLPNFETQDELADMVQSGEVSPEALAVIRKVLTADPHFFTRVEDEGLENVLKDYGYNTDQVNPSEGRPVEQSPAVPPPSDIRPAAQQVPPRPSGPPTPVAVQQDSPRVEESQGEEVLEEPDTTPGTVAQREPVSRDQVLGQVSAQFGGALKKRQVEVMLADPDSDHAVRVVFQEAYTPSHWRNLASEFGITPEEAYDNALRRGVDIVNQAKRALGTEPLRSIPDRTAPPDPVQAQWVKDILTAATNAGLNVNVVRGQLSEGAYDPATQTMTMVLSDAIGATETVLAFHEVGHHVIRTLSPEMQEAAWNAIRSLSDEALGLDLSMDSRIRTSDPAGQGELRLHEERLVEATALKLQQEGFNPQDAATFAQRWVRALADFYYRAALSVQRMFGFTESPALARRYFENKVRSFLAGDTRGQSYLEWLGLGKPAIAQRHSVWFPSTIRTAESMGADGMPTYDGVSDIDNVGTRFRLDNNILHSLPGADPAYSRQTLIERQIANLNHVDDLVLRGTNEAMKVKGVAEVVGKKNPVAWLRSSLRLGQTAEQRQMIKAELEQDGTPVQFDQAKGINDFKGESNQDAVLLQAMINTQALISRASNVKDGIVEGLEKMQRQVDKAAERSQKAEQQYTDIDFLANEASSDARDEFLRLMRNATQLSSVETVTEQQLKALDPTAQIRRYAPAFRKLFTQGDLKGENLFRLLDMLANDQTVDFNDSISKIREQMALSPDRYGKLTANTDEARAALSFITAFAKTHRLQMAEYELRRNKSGEQRVEIEQAAKEQESEVQDYRKNLATLARGAALKERYRGERIRARRDLRDARRALDSAKARIAAVDAATPVWEAERQRLASKLKMRQAVVWGHDMPYYAVKPGMKDSEIPESIKKLRLDSTGDTVTNPGELTEDLKNMRAWLTEHQDKAAAGDDSALGVTYQTVLKQYRELADRKDFSTRVSPADRWIGEFAMMAEGVKLEEAFGTAVARALNTMWNKMQATVQRFKLQGEPVGRKTTRLEDDLMRLMPDIDRDTLRREFLNPAKGLMRNRTEDLAEVYAGEPEKLRRAIMNRVKEHLLNRASTKPSFTPVADRAMPILAKLLDHQWEADQMFMGWNGQGGMAVADPKLRVVDPVTGQTVTAERRPVALSPYTFSQKLANHFGVMGNALANSNWAALGDMLQTTGDAPSEFLTMLREAPDQAREFMTELFNHDEHGQQVREKFFRELASMPVRSWFNAPAQEDAITKPPADVAKVLNVLDDIGTADPIAFFQALFDAHGATGDSTAYVEEQVRRLNDAFKRVDAMHRDHNDVALDKGGSIRGMTPSYLIDASEVQDLPAPWFDYHSYDQEDVFRSAERISSQINFGRGQEQLARLFETLTTEARAAEYKLKEERDKVLEQHPTWTKKQVEKQVKLNLKDAYKPLAQQEQRIPLIAKVVKQVSDYYRRNASPDTMMRTVSRAFGNLGGVYVNNPGSAIYQNSDIFNPVMKYGVSGRTLKATGKGVKELGSETVKSFAQAFGLQILKGNKYHDRRVRIGQIDPARARKFQDIFDRLENESAGSHLARSFGDIMGTTFNPLGEKAESVVIRPLQPFTTSALLVNRGLTTSLWSLIEDYAADGYAYLKNNPDSLSNPEFKVDADILGLTGADRDSFLKLERDMARFGVSFDTMVKSAFERNDGTLMSDEEAYGTLAMGLSEVSSEASLSNMPLSSYNNPVYLIAKPLLSWAFRRSRDLTSLRLNSQGKLEMEAFLRGFAGFATLAMGGLGVSLLADSYYDELLGKHRNLRSWTNPQSPEDFALGTIEAMNRVGTFGVFGDVGNLLVGAGPGGDNRTFSLDQRVLAASAVRSFFGGLNAWAHQGTPDYTRVVRPLLLSMGGNGALHYMGIASRVFDADTPESRITKRINANNWLRAIGRQLNMEVRPFGSFSDPTPMSAPLSAMELSVYANDPTGFQSAYRDAVKKAAELGKEDPVDFVKRSFSTRHPLRSVFRTAPSSGDYSRLLLALPEGGRDDVGEAVDLFNRFGSALGIKEFEGKAPKQSKPSLSGIRFGNSDALRSRAMQALYD